MSALRVVFVAFGANALLIVLQTVIFQLLPYDSSASTMVAFGLRVGFALADVTTFASLVVLARAERSLRGLVVVGATLAAFAVLSGALGLSAKLLGAEARGLSAMARAASAGEPALSLGTTLLVTLSLAALAKPHGSRATARAGAVTLAVAISVALSLGFRALHLIDRTPRSLPGAWASWLFEVTRPALVAWLAFSLLRALGRVPRAETRPEGPYRAAGEGAPAAERKEAFDAVALRTAARGLASYRVGFVVRVGLAIVLLGAFAVATTLRRANEALFFFTIAMPGLGVVTAVALVLGLVRWLALPRGVGARRLILGAIGALVLAALLDTATLVFGAYAFFQANNYWAMRSFSVMMVELWPLVALASGVSLLCVASALQRLGERLEADRAVRRALWVQGLAIGAGAAQIGAALSAIQASSSGEIVTGGLVVAALGATAATLILHVLLVGGARVAVLAEVGETPRPG